MPADIDVRVIRALEASAKDLAKQNDQDGAALARDVRELAQIVAALAKALAEKEESHGNPE